MSRDSQQLARLVRQVTPLLRHRNSPRALAALAVVLVAYLAAVPWLNSSLDWNLPGWRQLTSASQTAPVQTPPAARPTTPPPAPTPSKPANAAPQSDPRLAEILAGTSRQAYESPAGLRYTRGSQHGHRLLHLMAHTRDEPDRPGSHGVFDSQAPAHVVALVDEAYALALRGEQTQTSREEERMVYTVNLRRRIGYVGGEGGRRQGHPAAQRLRLVVDDRDLITAFPLR